MMRWMMMTAAIGTAVLLPATSDAQMLLDTTAAMAVSDSMGASQAINSPLYMQRAKNAASTASDYAKTFQMYSARTAGGDMLGNTVERPEMQIGDWGAGMGAGMGMGGMMANNTPQISPMQSFMRAVQGVQSTASNALTIIATRDPQIQYVTVFLGQRVLCAVTGQMLEDVNVVKVPVDKDKKEEDLKRWMSEQGINVQDDGIMDNGIAGDGVYGDIKISSADVIGPEANRLRVLLLRVLHQVEYLAPNTVVDYKSMIAERTGPPPLQLGRSGIVIDPTSGKTTNYTQETQSIMRFFLMHILSEGNPEPNPMPWAGSKNIAQPPTIMELQRMRDDYLREWQNRFLASYRIDPEDPRSDFYPVYIPGGPSVPEMDEAYVAGAIKLSAITGQGFPITALRPEVSKQFITSAMEAALEETAPDTIPDPAAERVRVPLPTNYIPPQNRENNTNNANGAMGANMGMGGGMPGMMGGPGMGGPGMAGPGAGGGQAAF
ncbi:hypothetical protein GX645_00765 [Candidatus Sumerlaeota bacterium]|nr:hypothetical protein [Candidatus Sumerlaeota bacterium]